MPVFVYDGTLPQHAAWMVQGRAFPAGVPVFVTDAQAMKLRRLPFFFEVASLEENSTKDDADDAVIDLTPTDEVPKEPQAKRKRGRPPGSKNRAKVNHGNENIG